MSPDWEPLWRTVLSPEWESARRHRLVNWPMVVRQAREELRTAASSIPILTGVMFEREVLFPEGGGYRIVWDVHEAQKLIRQLSLPQEIWRADFLRDFAAEGSGEGSGHFETPGPVIWSRYPLMDPPGVIIDGNHRVKGAPDRALITGYELPRHAMLASMATDAHRLFYEWHWSIANWGWAERQTAGSPDVPIPAALRDRPEQRSGRHVH